MFCEYFFIYPVDIYNNYLIIGVYLKKSLE